MSLSLFVLGFGLGIATMIGVSGAFGVIMLLKARDADAQIADRRQVGLSPSAWRQTGI